MYRPKGRGKEFLEGMLNSLPPSLATSRIRAKFNSQMMEEKYDLASSSSSIASDDSMQQPLLEDVHLVEVTETNKEFESMIINRVSDDTIPLLQDIHSVEVVETNKEFESTIIDDFKSSNLFHREKVPHEIIEQIRSLPIYAKRNELVNLIENNQIVIVIGETGSGKSTQIPQFIADAGMIKDDCMIGITQPRRVAAKSLAERVALECGVDLGNLVGYAVRFDTCLSPTTIIKYMTDGLLVKDCTQDETKLDSYSVIMVDEAHERSVHTDVAFGLLKRAAKKRPDLKIIISSATLEVEKFSHFFDDAPVFRIAGRGFDVELVHEISYDYLEDAFRTIVKIHQNGVEAKGDILAFLTGQEDIETIRKLLQDYCAQKPLLPMIVVPCHATLPFDEQQKIFETTPPGYRKVVLATNIAETSITIDNIAFIVDCGYVKEKRYNPCTKIESLMKVRITKFQAIQRQGRAGRTQPGKCYRLYSERLFNEFNDAQKPDIQRSNVEAVLLDLFALGIENPKKFEFIDAPTDAAIDEALVTLQELSALDSAFNLTLLGRQMASYPLEPSLAKVLITASKLGCATETLKIVAILSTQYQNLFIRTDRSCAEFRKAKEVFDQPEGDHLTILKIYDQWTENECSEEWCQENFLQCRSLAEAKDIKEQLTDIMIKNQLLSTDGKDLVSCEPSLLKDNICRAFTSGYFYQLGKKSEHGFSYQKLGTAGEQEKIFLHPTSALFPKAKLPEWIIFQEVAGTAKTYVFIVSAIEPKWIMDYAPEFWKKLQM